MNSRISHLALRFLSVPLVFALSPLFAQQPPTERTIDAPNPEDMVNELTAPSAPRVPKLEILFGYFSTDRAALSPDGKHIAYTLREGDIVSVIILEVDNPAVIKAKINVIDSEGASAMLDPNNNEKTPGAVRWMRWATNNRLVLESNLRVAISNGTDFVNAPQGGAIIGVDADGKNAKLLCTARDTSEYDTETKMTDSEILKSTTANTDASTPTGTTLASSEENTLPTSDTTTTSTVSARSPHIVDLIPGDPDHVLIRTDPALNKAASFFYTLYKLNIHTGKLKEVSAEYLELNRSTLMDRKGFARVSIPISFRNGFPHEFRYSTTSLFSRANPLDELTGQKDAFTVSPANYFGKRCVPLAFAEDGHTLYYASNLYKDTFGVYAIDISTGKPAGASFEHPVFDLYEPSDELFPNYNRGIGDEYGQVERFAFIDTVSPEKETLVYDRHERTVVGIRFQANRGTTAWLRPELHAAQIELEALMKGSNIKILEWDAARNRFLVFADSPSTPGSFFVYDRSAKKLSEFVSVQPLITEKNAHTNAEFSFKHPSGETVSGLLTLPRYVRISPPPLIIMCDALPWQRVRSVYKAEAQALANLGFAVAQISSRAAWGTGLKARASAGVGIEKAYAEDMVLVADQLCQRFKFNRQRVALYGDGLGAFCVLWTMQLHPEAFRCAVAINTVLDPAAAATDARNANGSVKLALQQSFFGGIDHMKTISLHKNTDKIVRPICFLQYRGPEGERRNLAYIDTQEICRNIKSRAADSELVDLDIDYMRGLAVSKSQAFRNIGGFLNICLYGFKTNSGPTKVIEEAKK